MDQNRVDKFNSLVRGMVTLGLTAGFIYGYVVSAVVSTEAYVGIFGSVIAWWFASRVQATRSTDTTSAPPTNGGPKP